MNAMLPVDPVNATAILTPATSQPVNAAPLVAPQWETLVTPGHVLAPRVVRWSKVRFPVAILCGLGALWTGYMSLQASSLSVMSLPILPALVGNPAIHTDLGGGTRVSYQAAFLEQYPIERGLSVEAWGKLVDAVIADTSQFGTDATNWTATAELETAPKITRPEKALSEHSGRLATGIVVLPENEPTVQIIGFVDGAWAFVNLDYAGCIVAFGPEHEGCTPAIAFTQYQNALLALKPAPASEIEE